MYAVFVGTVYISTLLTLLNGSGIKGEIVKTRSGMGDAHDIPTKTPSIVYD
jgi:hypothetical protein